MRLLADPASTANEFTKPGHVVPLRAKDGGVLRRPGHTEAAVDLARLAGLQPAGTICEIVSQKDEGAMAQTDELRVFADEHSLALISIADLIEWRRKHEKHIERIAEARIPTRHGEFRAVGYTSIYEDVEHVALVRGDIAGARDPVLVRVQSMCPVADPFRTRPDLVGALDAIDRAPAGVFLYVFNKARTSLSRSFARQVVGETAEAQGAADRSSAQSDALRDFGLGAQVLVDLGCNKIRLMSNADRRIVGIEGFGIEVVERISLPQLSGARVLPIARGDRT